VIAIINFRASQNVGKLLNNSTTAGFSRRFCPKICLGNINIYFKKVSLCLLLNQIYLVKSNRNSR
jgi:hypothetical protein